MSIFKNRRVFMRWVAAGPVLGIIAGHMAKLTAASRSTSADVYSRIGVRPFINGRGTWTYLSGSLELPAVRRAKEAAAHHFVDMFELQRAVGKRLAQLSGAESGMVTSGAAGAMAAATGARMAGADPARIWQLSDATGLKHEVVMLGGRSAFDSAIRLVGAKLVVAHTHDELRAALNESTAMVYTTWRDDRVQQALAITRPFGVPLMVDDAAGIPPLKTYRASPNWVSTYVVSAAEKGCAGLSVPASCWAART